MLNKSKIAVAVAVACVAVGNAFAAGNTLFDDVTPNLVPNVPIPAGGAAEFTAPNFTSALVLPTGPGITITQTSIAQRNTQLANGQLNSGLWDMIDTNRTGPDAGRYLFAPFEPGFSVGSGAGVQRTDLQTGITTTIVNPGNQTFIRGDASRWTPWGSYLTAEEDWSAVSGGVRHGRLFELTNPVATTGDATSNFVHRSVLPRVSHEGLVFDKDNNLYFIDEFNGGAIYKYVSNNPNAANGNDFFASGQTFAAKVNGGNNSNAVGNIVWTPITDANGGVLAGVTQLIDGTTIDGRASADTALATNYQRPEDMEIKTLANGDQIVLIATTTTNDIYSMNLATSEMKVFASQATANVVGGNVGSALVSPDNLAIDADGNFYIIEDQGETNADIWLARDANDDGVAESLQRWAGMQVTGAEPTGLYFDIFKPNTAYLNIQHPTSGNDQLIMIQAVPEPGEYAMMLAGLGLVGAAVRYRHKKV